ncbi:MAG: SDR family oxidoreductase [Rubrivivax sp.]|jgi:NAD(P)-dependent dehydrogenase (short-subunit alcohol dehydrogenase family)|nr:SDR family oxidoreductase [Rubrivivax sp.]
MADDIPQPRVALLTAAGSGIGAAAARRLAADGWRVAILSSSGKGEALAAALGGIGVRGDNRQTADLQGLLDAALARWGRVDAVVNSAGHGPKGDLLDISDADWHLGAEFYLLNVVKIARLVTPVFERQGGGGAIVNVSTYATFEPEAAFPTSGVFRSALAAFSKLYADRYAGSGIRINNVLPGFIDSLPEKEERRSRIPMQRYGTSDEVAALIAFLAGPEAAYITGQNIRIDGGITRSV